MTSSNLVACTTGRSAGSSAIQDAAGIDADLVIRAPNVTSIAHQSTGSRLFASEAELPAAVSVKARENGWNPYRVRFSTGTSSGLQPASTNRSARRRMGPHVFGSNEWAYVDDANFLTAEVVIVHIAPGLHGMAGMPNVDIANLPANSSRFSGLSSDAQATIRRASLSPRRPAPCDRQGRAGNPA